MTIFELREIALRYATQATAINIGGTVSYAMPDVVVGRAKAYLEFLNPTAIPKPAARKRVRR